MTKKLLTGDDAVTALSTAVLIPPPRPVNFSEGATADLRDAMARFSAAKDHGPRRAAVMQSVGSIDLELVEQTSAELMTERLNGALDVVAAGWEIPTFTLATVFGFADQRQQIRDDVEAVARVIGRGEASNPEADAATTRLLGLFGDHEDPVAPVSILYQNFDATGALLPTMVLAAFASTGPPAHGSTVRVAEESVLIGEHTIAPGEAVQIDLEGIRWGAGPHKCPGEAVANAIVAGAVRAVIENRYMLRSSQVEVDSRNVPIRFEIYPATGRG